VPAHNPLDGHAVLPSRWLCAWIAVLAVAAMALSVAFLPFAAGLVVAVAIAWSAVRAAKRDALLLAPQSVVGLRLSIGGLETLCCNGQWQFGVVLGTSVASRWLTVIALNDAAARQRRYVVLMPDSLDRDAARQVRRWLRWGKTTSKGSQ
jgi:hypothetical protein